MSNTSTIDTFDEEGELDGYQIEESDDDGDDMDESVIAGSQTTYNPKHKYNNTELTELADALLREDANRELCRQCREKDPESLPYGQETGNVEWMLRKDKQGNALLDDEGNVQYIAFPELECAAGHRWYLGEGVRRNINGKNPILFEPHLYNRKRREIHVKDGVPDPAFTMDRWGKRPTQGMYYRVHPQGRKQNTDEQRKRNGASFYRHCTHKLEGSVTVTSDGLFTDKSRTNRADQTTRAKAYSGDGASMEIGPTWW